jgi:hypothetical protein
MISDLGYMPCRCLIGASSFLPAVRVLQPAQAVLSRPGEGVLHLAEELALHEVAWDR